MSVFLNPIRLGLLPLTALVLTGCATTDRNWHGPAQRAPVAAARASYLRAPVDTRATAPAAHWWEALGDPVLNAIEARALIGSPDLAAAQARIAQARATLDGARGAGAPSASVSALAAEASLPAALLGRSGRLSEQVYADNFQASWEADLFGANRRRTDAAGKRAEASVAAAGDVAVALSAQVARAYVDLRQQQAVAALLDRQVDDDQQALVHAQNRLAGGTAPAQNVENAATVLAQTRIDLAQTRAQITILGDQLAVLTGAEPGALDALVAAPAPVPQVPATIAVGDPAQLLRHRPDIRQAEALLAAANADVNARMADRFPKVSFTGILGLGGTSVTDAFTPASLIALILPQIKWSPIDGGRSKALVRGAQGARDEAEANYQARVLTALQDAENALTRFGSQRIAVARSLEQRDAADRVAKLQAGRAAGGTVSRADAVLAARQALRAQLGALAAQAQLITDFIAVEKALGLGWDQQ
ncbi:efflux transporter outer membrane subunit [Novosphingobium sp.]|uniref:efflux transporter outer membrane subunit n=1 Tax=Novosphingobium sp. TaxID=1874826 RepID=UPI003340EDD5